MGGPRSRFGPRTTGEEGTHATVEPLAARFIIGERCGVTVQDAESRLDRVELELLPGPESIGEARRFVRGYMELSGAQWEAAERMVQLVAELQGPGTVPVTLALEEFPSVVRLSLQLRSPADYAAVQWWRAQHPLGIGPWRLYVSRLADEWSEGPHLGGVLLTAVVRHRLPGIPAGGVSTPGWLL
jgi:hypothetical protein